MTDDLGYGRRLRDEEYDRSVVALEEEMSSMPTKEQERANRRAQLDLAIDHRLGCDFPLEKREALWVIMGNVEARRLRLSATYIISRLFSFGRRERHHSALGLAGFMVDQFSHVLNERELESYFELEGGRPTLPTELADRSK
jgi:hypothetical protein